jgi:hypothetical protein
MIRRRWWGRIKEQLATRVRYGDKPKRHCSAAHRAEGRALASAQRLLEHGFLC